MNRVILTGRITKDIELKSTSQGVYYTFFTLAVNRAYSKNQEVSADFINCVAWRDQAELMGKYLNKGSLIGIEGKIQVRKVESEQFGTRYITEVVCDRIEFLESKSESEARRNNSSNYAGEPEDPYRYMDNNSSKNEESQNDFPTQDDLPF